MYLNNFQINFLKNIDNPAPSGTAYLPAEAYNLIPKKATRDMNINNSPFATFYPTGTRVLSIRVINSKHSPISIKIFKL